MAVQPKQPYQRGRETPFLEIRRALGGGTPIPYYVLAAYCLVSPSTLSRVERDPKDTHVRTLDKIVRGLRALGVPSLTAEMLLGREPLPPNIEPLRKE